MGRRGRLHDGAIIIIIITVARCVHEINFTKKKRVYIGTLYTRSIYKYVIIIFIIQMKTSCVSFTIGRPAGFRYFARLSTTKHARHYFYNLYCTSNCPSIILCLYIDILIYIIIGRGDRSTTIFIGIDSDIV